MDCTGRICGVIGRRLTHSLSPKLMNHLAVLNGFEERFRPIELALDEIPALLDNFRQAPQVCINVTAPYKEEVIPYLDDLSGDASDAHAVNIITGGNGALKGYNSDIQGFLAPMDFINEIKTSNEGRDLLPAALILGSGGAAAAVILGLLRTWGEGRIILIARDRVRLDRRVRYFNEKFNEYPMEITAADTLDDAMQMVFREKETKALLVNATPIGQWPDAGDSPFQSFEMKDDDLVDFGYYYDIVYNPIRTAAAKRMESVGAKVVGGVDWFCRQAVLSAELFFGKRPSEDEVRGFVENELRRMG